MLKQRMITAAWLAPVTLIGLFGLQGGAFALFTALIVLLGTWEWTNLAGVIVSRTRLAINWVTWLPKSRMRIRSAATISVIGADLSQILPENR